MKDAAVFLRSGNGIDRSSGEALKVTNVATYYSRRRTTHHTVCHGVRRSALLILLGNPHYTVRVTRCAQICFTGSPRLTPVPL